MINWTVAGPLVERLRADEGTSVTLCSDNADFNGLPNCAILACNLRTNWEEKFYRADTVEACLAMALADMATPDTGIDGLLV